MSTTKPTSTYEHDQELFADTLLQLQVHSALAKEHVQNKKSPLPLLAKSCALFDNLPTRSPHWTPVQEKLIGSLRIDAWIALSDGCIQSKDLIQAEACLQRLSSLQDAAAGPLSLRSKPNKYKGKPNTTSSTSSSTNSSGASSSTSASLPVKPTEEQRLAASELMETWDKLRQIYSDMGRNDMANNFARRIDKMKDRLQESSLEL